MKNKKATGVLKRIIDNRDENLLKEQEHRID